MAHIHHFSTSSFAILLGVLVMFPLPSPSWTQSSGEVNDTLVLNSTDDEDFIGYNHTGDDIGYFHTQGISVTYRGERVFGNKVGGTTQSPGDAEGTTEGFSEDYSKYPIPDPPLAEWTCSSCNQSMMSKEKQLIKGLLENYDAVGRNGRPVYNISQGIDVEFGLGLIQMDLDEYYKILKMSMWSRYKWRDEYLRWDPEKFNGIEKIRLSADLVWVPDIMLYNTADPYDKARDVLAIIKYDGTVLWVPHQIFKSSCSIDVTNFPFDSQTCHMWFGSWTHPKSEVDVHMAFKEGIDLSTFQSDYKESSEWDIHSTVAEKRVMPSANETPNYAVLTFQLDMKRKLTFSSYILTLPCVFLACLTLVVFWLPPDRPDRTALAMSIFASFLMLLLILVESSPPTASSVPVLGVYYCFNMVIIMLSVFLSSLVVNVCRAGEGGRGVPKWLEFIMLECLARFLLMHKADAQTSAIVHASMQADDFLDESTPYSRHRNRSGGGISAGKGRKRHKLSAFCCFGHRGGDLDREDDCYEMGGNHNSCVVENNGTTQIHNPSTFPLLDSGRGASKPHERTTFVDNSLPFSRGSSNSEMRLLLDEQIREMRKSISHLRATFIDRVGTDSHIRVLCKQWKDVALVLDRLFFIMYILLIVISLCVLFPQPKY